MFKEQPVKIMVLIAIGLGLLYIIINYFFPLYPCAESFLLIGNSEKNVTNSNDALFELKGFLLSLPNTYSKDASKKLSLERQQYRKVIYSIPGIGPDFETTAWVFDNEYAIDMNGSVYSKGYCQ